MDLSEIKSFVVNQEQNNCRLDLVAAKNFSEFSRSQLKKWLEDGNLQVNSTSKLKANYKVKVGDLISLKPELSPQIDFMPEDIKLDIVYEDADILVLNKPAGLVMHPAAGHLKGTLLNALLHYLPEQQNLARAGIVHRLDKDTSGILVVAKTLEAQNSLVKQLQSRSLGRIYLALVWGKAPKSGQIELAIARSSRDRKKQSVDIKGKQALTYFKKLADYGELSLVECRLATGRTHQIRVHFSHIKMPLIGDKTYGRSKLNQTIDKKLATLLHKFPRQALHAKELHLIHPKTGKSMSFTTPLATDFLHLLQEIGQIKAEIFNGNFNENLNKNLNENLNKNLADEI